MNGKRLNALLETLFELKYDWSSGGSSYRSDVIHEEGRLVVEDVIRKYLLDNRDERIGVLEAKVFMYEQIISKSNFSPMLEDEKSSNESVLKYDEIQHLRRVESIFINRFKDNPNSDYMVKLGEIIDKLDLNQELPLKKRL